jgi:hypothetical protein
LEASIIEHVNFNTFHNNGECKITNGGAAALTAGLLPPAEFPESGKATLLLRLMPVFFMAPVLGLIPFMGGSNGGSFQPRPGVDGPFDPSAGFSAKDNFIKNCATTDIHSKIILIAPKVCVKNCVYDLTVA